MALVATLILLIQFQPSVFFGWRWFMQYLAKVAKILKLTQIVKTSVADYYYVFSEFETLAWPF